MTKNCRQQTSSIKEARNHNLHIKKNFVQGKIIFLIKTKSRKMSSREKPPPGLTIDRAAFLLLRVKRAFKKKKQQRKDKNTTSGESKTDIKSSSNLTTDGDKNYNDDCCRPAPLLRSKTLPSIIVPGLSILQKQLDARYTVNDTAGTTDIINRLSINTITTNDDSTSLHQTSSIKSNKFLTPRILFPDDNYASSGERRVSESGVEIRNRKGLHCSDDTKSLSSSGSSTGNSGHKVTTSQPLTRLARFLNQKPSIIRPDDNLRRLSWEKRDENKNNKIELTNSMTYNVPRSTSIDSIAYLHQDWTTVSSSSPMSARRFFDWRRGSGNDLTNDPLFSPASSRQSFSPCPSPTPSQLSQNLQTPLLRVRNSLTDRPSLIVSSNIGRRIKGHRAIIALFTAIEHGNLEKIKTILETADVDINSVNSDGLSPLDIAVLSNNKALIKILIAHGSQEGNEYKTTECLGSHLRSMLLSVEQRLGEMGGNSNNGTLGTSGALFLDAGSTRASFSAAHNNLTGCGGNAEEKQVALWERRIGTLRKLVKSFDQTKPPDVPLCVNISVIGSKSVMIELQDTENDESYACTKFKIQWSFDDDFSIIAGEKQVLNMKKKECQIDGLIQGKKYYFRACCGNLKGYSQFLLSSPPYVVPSSWRDIDGQLPRFSGRLEQLDELFNDIKRPEYSQDTPALQRRNHKKKTTIKQLFTATSKFQKILRRGVYLTCLIYHEDKVLVTNEDFLPVIEVDETYPSCIYNDFHWLMKVSCTWDDIKILKQDMERSNGSPANHFRLKLLQAAAQMQTALCIQDLGQVYYKPIRDIQGTLVFSTINYIKSPKLVSVLNSRWLPLNKVMKKLVIHEDSNVADILMASIQDQMTYHQLSSIKLTKGLYLGYLKMQSSVDLIQVVVPTKAPNSLPHFKIRDNCHVSAEEWDYLKKIKINFNELTNDYHDNEINNNNKDEIIDNNRYKYANEQQRLFIDNVASTARRLFSYMEINNDESLNHRLYDAEVIELSDEVSFLIIVPPAETACSVPGTREILLQRGDLLSLPIQVFEMVHLLAYQKNVIQRYSRLSCILELDTIHAQHNHREAFSTIELTEAKNKLAKLEKFQTQMNTIWKGARWLIDVITFARDRQTTSGISIKYLLNIERNNKTNGLKRTLLQLPSRDTKVVKSSPGRGSWPGPNISINNNNNNNNNNNIINSGKKNLLITEFSKSEQHLTTDILTNDCRSRKASDTSNFSTGSEPTKPTSLYIDDDDDDDVDNNDPGSLIKHSSIMPPSKSEDTLLINKYSNSSSINTAGVTSGLSLSASTSPQFYVKPLVYGNALLSDSDSLQSVNSDEISGGSNLHQHLTGTNKKKIKDKTLKIKSKKPTASVAAMASNLLLSSTSTSSLPPMNTHIDDVKDQMASSTSTSTTTTMPAPMPGILQVFAAYDTGLAAGTSLKLHVTPRTTAREVVDLVVKQLNMAVVLKGQEGPIYTADELPNFCLVAVIGARERCLRDDFKPLQLQNPWKKGRLYVRLKQDVLAALEHSSKLTAYL
ncbi:hypothetical protein HCN44_008428 [Aphidius gifuensis]|uniref:Ankyrin repeat and fibronectin type-III domain-containing protein 1 n=2 Tax=Aphidius gifuensis TaxID=684658 RepID=A0A834XR42_APHGI|nr:hypothetical protein HCN44_008428 [Aphidius gifuensis]